MDQKNDAPKGSSRNAKNLLKPAGQPAFVNETDAMHQQALAEIKARGEDPEQILREMDSMTARLREKHLRPKTPPAPDELIVVPNFNDDAIEWSMGGSIFFDESVAAGIPTHGGESYGRRTEMSDVMPGINTAGKLHFKITCVPPSSIDIKHGDEVLVDPEAELRDGYWVLAELKGHDQVVLRMRIDEAGAAIFESGSSDIKPIKASEAWGLRIHGKIIWRFSSTR